MPLPGFEPGSQPPRGCILSRLDYRSFLLDLQKLYKYLSFTIIKMKEPFKKAFTERKGCTLFKPTEPFLKRNVHERKAFWKSVHGEKNERNNM